MLESNSEKCEYAVNRFSVFALIFTVIFAVLAVLTAGESVFACVFFFLLCAVCIFVFFISAPYYRFSEKEVVICYWFGLREAVLYDNIREIYQDGSDFLQGRGPSVYVIAYPHKKDKYFS